MRAIIPQKLKILNDSVPEDEATPWSDNTTYAVGDKVIDDHYVYFALTAHAGKRPSANADTADAPWRTMAVTNKYACIDLYRTTRTLAPEGQTTLIIEVPFTRPATAVGLLGMFGSSLTVTLYDADGAIAWGGEPMSLWRDAVSWWDYFFGGFRSREDLVLTGIAPVTGRLRVELTGGRPAIGSIIVGEMVVFGDTAYDVATGLVDYSVNTTDPYGNEIWVKRRNSRRGTFPVFIEPENLDYVQQKLAELSGNPALWIGDNGTGYQSMVISGFLKDFDARMPTHGVVTATFDIRGIV